MKRFNKKEVRCLGGIYGLSFVDMSTDVDLHGEQIGCTNLLGRSIKVAGDMAASQQRDTLLHEIVHIADYETADPRSRLRESDVVRISKALYSILRDNPGLAEWIASDDQ